MVFVKLLHYKMSIVDTYLQDASNTIFIIHFSKFSQIRIQKLRLYCDPMQSERETACEIYSVASDIYSNNLVTHFRFFF